MSANPARCITDHFARALTAQKCCRLQQVMNAVIGKAQMNERHLRVLFCTATAAAWTVTLTIIVKIRCFACRVLFRVNASGSKSNINCSSQPLTDTDNFSIVNFVDQYWLHVRDDK